MEDGCLPSIPSPLGFSVDDWWPNSSFTLSRSALLEPLQARNLPVRLHEGLWVIADVGVTGNNTSLLSTTALLLLLTRPITAKSSVENDLEVFEAGGEVAHPVPAKCAMGGPQVEGSGEVVPVEVFCEAPKCCVKAGESRGKNQTEMDFSVHSVA
jgi:hypothetical protein